MTAEKRAMSRPVDGLVVLLARLEVSPLDVRQTLMQIADAYERGITGQDVIPPGAGRYKWQIRQEPKQDNDGVSIK
jgi:hypothetical protein